MRILLLAAAVLFAAQAGARAAVTDVTYYLQLVRGSDDPAPPAPGAKRLGAKLDSRLQAVFRWKHYWELKRDSVTVKLGQKVRRRLSEEREVELTLVSERELDVRLYRKGQQTCLGRQAAKAEFFVLGGDKETNQSWFIVVRRDKPPEE